MDRLYFKLVEKCTDLVVMANSLAMNANFREDVDQETRKHLLQYYEAVETARSVLFRAVSRQMKNDPTERDL